MANLSFFWLLACDFWLLLTSFVDCFYCWRGERLRERERRRGYRIDYVYFLVFRERRERRERGGNGVGGGICERAGGSFFWMNFSCSSNRLLIFFLFFLPTFSHVYIYTRKIRCFMDVPSFLTYLLFSFPTFRFDF